MGVGTTSVSFGCWANYTTPPRRLNPLHNTNHPSINHLHTQLRTSAPHQEQEDESTTTHQPHSSTTSTTEQNSYIHSNSDHALAQLPSQQTSSPTPPTKSSTSRTTQADGQQTSTTPTQHQHSKIGPALKPIDNKRWTHSIFSQPTQSIHNYK